MTLFIYAFEMVVNAVIPSHVIRRFSCRLAHTVLTFRKFTTLSGWPGLVTGSSGKRLFLKLLYTIKNVDSWEH